MKLQSIRWNKVLHDYLLKNIEYFLKRENAVFIVKISWAIIYSNAKN